MRQPSWVFLGLLLTLFTARQGAAQEGSSELDRLIREALTGNPALAEARARWDAARAMPAQVGSLPDPVLGAKVIRFRDRGVGIRGEGETWYSLSQEVPFPGKLGLRSRIADRNAERTGKDYEAARLDVIEAVRIAYYGLLHAEVLEEVTVQNRQLLESTLEIARARYEVGSVPQQELLLARVEYARVDTDLAELRRMRQSAIAELHALVGRRSDPNVTVAMQVEPAPPAVSLDVDSLTARALGRRPEMAAARSAAARDTIALRLARKAYLPDFSVGAEYWVGEGDNPDPLPDERYVVDVGLTMPWIWKGKHDAGVREGRAQLQASRHAFESQANRVRQEVETAVAEVRAAEDRVRTFEASILPEASLNLEGAVEAYQTDRVGFLTLLDTQRSLNELRIAYHTARVELLVGWARLDRALGNLPAAVDPAEAAALTRPVSRSEEELGP